MSERRLSCSRGGEVLGEGLDTETGVDERVEDDQEIWLQFERGFFAERPSTHEPTTTPKAKGKARGKRKVGRIMGKLRDDARRVLQAVDHLLTMFSVRGLAAFLPLDAKEQATPLSVRKLLVMFLDEASPQLAMNMFLTYKLKVRLVNIRDLHHRKWNDCSNAIKKSGKW